MSYDLNFWKQPSGLKIDPETVYAELCQGETVEWLEDLPIERIMARIEGSFGAGWERIGPNVWDSAEGAFEVSTTPQSFRIDCWGLTGEIMNQFIEIGIEFGCYLYDPQTNVRYAPEDGATG